VKTALTTEAGIIEYTWHSGLRIAGRFESSRRRMRRGSPPM
jgi:hypothetical protein